GGPAVSATFVDAVVSGVVAALWEGLVAGQDPAVVSSGQTTLLAAVYSVDGDESVSVTVPLSNEATALGKTSSQVSFPANASILVGSGYSSLSLGIASLPTDAQASATSNLLSGVTRIYMSGNDLASDNRRLRSLHTRRHLVNTPLSPPPPPSSPRMDGTIRRRGAAGST
ncbi:unnamed protein product, partial [Phaeothamnion confervicola]